MATSTPISTEPVGLMRALSGLMERAAFAMKAGITFGGKRDLYEALGYKRVLTPQDYRARYERGGLAARIVEAFPNATWRGGAELVEDDDPETETEFEAAFDELDKRLHVWPMLMKTDVLAGLGRYSVLLIGAPGRVEEELPMMRSADDIMFLAPYAQDEATILEIENDSSNERFGLPILYRIVRRSPFLTGRTSPIFDRTVHWSRVLHVADLALDDRVFGHSRLERCWNDLDNLDKIVGGGSEAFWLRVHQGYFFNFDPEVKIDPSAVDKIKEEAEEFAHGLRRTIAMRGAKAEVFGSDVANFANQINAIVSLLAGATGIPQRLFLGSERGELASTQDKENWNDRVQDRRRDFAEPYVLRPLIDRFIEYGVLPEPEDYEAKWPEIDELNEDGKSTVATAWAGLNAASGGVVVLPEEIRDHVLGLAPLTPKQIADATPEPPAPPPPPIIVDPNHPLAKAAGETAAAAGGKPPFGKGAPAPAPAPAPTKKQG